MSRLELVNYAVAMEMQEHQSSIDRIHLHQSNQSKTNIDGTSLMLY